jgi:hypothetical protein
MRSYRAHKCHHLDCVSNENAFMSVEIIGLNGVRSPKFIWAPVYSCTFWLRLRNSPHPPAFELIYEYEGAIGHWLAKIDDISWTSIGDRSLDHYI